MGFNIENFKSARDRKNSVLKSNRFKVQITNHPPAMQNNNDGFATRDLEFWCGAIQIPGYQLQTHNMRRYTYGPNEIRPFAPNFQQLQLQIDNDGDGSIWKYFSSWMQSILPHDFTAINQNSTHGNKNLVYTIEYAEKYVMPAFNILVFRETGEEVYNIEVRRAFPVNINSIPLMWGDQNQAMRFDVFMDFSDWKLVELQTASPLPPSFPGEPPITA